MCFKNFKFLKFYKFSRLGSLSSNMVKLYLTKTVQFAGLGKLSSVKIRNNGCSVLDSNQILLLPQLSQKGCIIC
jgi:hypothetical protein